MLCLGEYCGSNDQCFGYPGGNVKCDVTCQCKNGYVAHPDGHCVPGKSTIQNELEIVEIENRIYPLPFKVYH